MTVGEALRKLKGAGRIRSEWLPGMLNDFGQRVIVVGQGGIVRHWAEDSARSHRWKNDEPDVTDVATVGCLMAIAREASGHPELVVVLHARNTDNPCWVAKAYCEEDSEEIEWWDPNGDGLVPSGLTESAALSSLLVSLAGAE